MDTNEQRHREISQGVFVEKSCFIDDAMLEAVL